MAKISGGKSLEAFRKSTNGNSKDGGDEFTVSAADAAKEVGVTSKTIVNKALAGLLPFRRKGRSSILRYFFRKKDIRALRRDYAVGKN